MPRKSGALGTSRTIVVDPAQHNLLGGFQYRELLPLNDKEVVITFDDGPLPPYSTRILDILAHECVKATFFMVGRMARAFPKIVRRTHDEGHTLANHSQNHPFNFHTMSVADAAREIDGAFEFDRDRGRRSREGGAVLPVSRPASPGRRRALSRVEAGHELERGLHGRRLDAHQFARDRRRALTRLEAKGKGILLLHDIQPATALGLPELLAELKARGYRVVHVVPSSAGLSATITTADQWLVRHPPTREQLAHREPSVWPRVLPHRIRTSVAAMEAPSVMSFGAETHEDAVPVMLVSSPAPLRNGDAEIAMPTVWPEEVITIAALPEVDLLPAPAANNFRYNRIIRSRAKKEKRRPSREITNSTTNADVTGSIPDRSTREPKAKNVTNTKARTNTKAGTTAKSETNNKSGTNTKSTTNSKAGTTHKSGKPRSADQPSTIPAGHQIQITRPQASLTPSR